MYLLSLLSFGNFILFILLCAYIIKFSPIKSKLNKYAFFVCASLGIWNLFFIFFYGSLNKDTAWFFYKMATIGMYSFPVFTLKFFIMLAKQEQMLSSAFKKAVLHLPQVALILYMFFSRTTPLADDLALSDRGLGWTYVNRGDKISFWVTLLYLILYLGISLYILYRWGKESKYQIVKKQARLFLIGNSIVLILGIMTDFILPLYGSQIPPMANIFTIIFMMLFYYIIRALNLFNINQVASSKVIINTLLEPILVLDYYGTVVQANPATEYLFGFTIDFLQGKKLSEVFVDNIEIQENDYGEAKIKNVHHDEIYVIFSKKEVRDQWNGYLGTVIHFKDITKMKQEENKLRVINGKYTKAAKKLEQVANRDTLTGIPNRRRFLKTLSNIIEDSEKNSRDFGLIFMDLNGFKEVNDELGHGTGDKVLIETAHRLQSLLKANDLVARLGGDEFVMLVTFDDKKEIYERSEMIQEFISKPIHLGEVVCQISVATGISVYSENTSNMEDMIHSADLAMYEHKRHK
ncbi:MAG TPA: diguanylate cyclase [Epulopiscium sp.]|nr:diguanylate cyclase [Candidatus Epulonipiscium sp.]